MFVKFEIYISVNFCKKYKNNLLISVPFVEVVGTTQKIACQKFCNEITFHSFNLYFLTKNLSDATSAYLTAELEQKIFCGMTRLF